ncbi:hypothetical protein ABZY05_05225 [Streptomyces canus]|uniref:hypothetical protein n=1 Tax=Streptomyces canus TaxID=58343 RepID=UPI0033B10ABC
MDRMDVEELLRQHAVDGSGLDPAPPETGDRLTDDPQVRARYRADAWRPCCVCGTDYRTSRVIDFPGCGPRWVDLCRDHSLAVRKPALPTMPATVEGAFADIREAAAKLGLTMRRVSHEEWLEMGRRARQRRDQ